MNLLSGRIAVVAGLDEIGLGVARAFLDEGAEVVLTDRDAKLARSAAEKLGCAWSTDVAAAAAEAGRLDVLAANLLGPPDVAPLQLQTRLAFDEAMGWVADAAEAMQQAFPWMRDGGGGRIVVVGHRYGETVHEAIGPYAAAAWALVGLTRSAAVDWGPFQISVNLLLPLAETGELARARDRRPKIIELMSGQLPLGRAGNPVHDVGAAAVYLAGDDARFVTGQTVHADGGQHIAGPLLNPARYAS